MENSKQSLKNTKVQENAPTKSLTETKSESETEHKTSEEKPKSIPKSKIIGTDVIEPPKIKRLFREQLQHQTETTYFNIVKQSYPNVKNMSDKLKIEITTEKGKKSASKKPKVQKKNKTEELGVTTVKVSKKKTTKPKKEKDVVEKVTENDKVYKILTVGKYIETLYPKIKDEFSVSICVILNYFLNRMLSESTICKNSDGTLSEGVIDKSLMKDRTLKYFYNVRTQNYDRSVIVKSGLFTDKQLTEYICEKTSLLPSKYALNYIKFLMGELFSELCFCVISFILPNKVKMLTQNIVTSSLKLTFRSEELENVLLERIKEANSKLSIYGLEKDIELSQRKLDDNNTSEEDKTEAKRKLEISTLEKAIALERVTNDSESEQKIKKLQEKLIVFKPQRIAPGKRKKLEEEAKKNKEELKESKKTKEEPKENMKKVSEEYEKNKEKLVKLENERLSTEKKKS